MPPDYSWKATFTAFNARYPGPQARRQLSLRAMLVVLPRVRMRTSLWCPHVRGCAPCILHGLPIRPFRPRCNSCSLSNDSTALSRSTGRILPQSTRGPTMPPST